MGQRPTIGITTSFGDNKLSLKNGYVRAVENACGCPPVSSAHVMRRIVSAIDALVIPGAPGIEQGLVGSLPDDLSPTDEVRARSDGFALEADDERELPVLGICYGRQFINSLHGGTIYGEVQRDCGVSPYHPRRCDADTLTHDVTLEPDTPLAKLISSPGPINTFHVQVVAELGKDLVLTLRSQDGLIEGFESADGRLTGVQFRPERLPNTQWDHLFTDLVKKANE